MAWQPGPDIDTLDDAFYDIMTKLTHSTWNKFARSALRLDQNDIDDIKSLYSQDAKEMKFHMCKKWAEKVGSAATIETAYDVLNYFLFPRKFSKPDLSGKQSKPSLDRPPSYSTLSPTKADALPFLDEVPLIDNPDAYSNQIRRIEVSPTDLNFYERNERHADSNYSRKGKGRTLILNNNFHHLGENSGQRMGSEIDLRNMRSLWESLGTEVSVHVDLTANDIKRELANFSDACDGSDFCVIFIMSHGTFENNEDRIYGNDHKSLSVKDEVIGLFNNANSQHLQGIPKLFFFQCCRGTNPDRGVQAYSPTSTQTESRSNICPPFRADAFQPDSGPISKKFPTSSDTLEFYATQSGNQAFRNTETGSWFVNAIANVFMRHAKDKHVAELMTIVNRAVSTQVTDGGEHGAMAMPVYTSQLVKNLFFYPGIDVSRVQRS